MKNAFALVYVIIFVGIITITITSLASFGVSDARQSRKAIATDNAFQMAESGIEDGIANIQKDFASVQDKDIFYNVNGIGDPKVYYFTDARHESPVANDQGDYQFRVTVDDGTHVESIGYFKKSKVKMIADCDSAGENCKIYQAGF